MDTLLDRFNARDVPGWDATFHYPHVLVSGSTIRTFTDPAQQADTIKNLVAQGWARSAWGDLRIVQCTPSRTHVAATFVRFRADGSELSRTAAIYTIDERDGRWGVTLRSLLPSET
ncbi:hypothetical protein GC169_07155 [bacterium]|nr:hypothetical protein [bacterium]